MSETRRLGWLLATVAMLGGGCDKPDAPEQQVPQDPPVIAPANTWTWVDVPSSTCDEGTPTGMGVNLSSGSKNLVIFFQGGGACWDSRTCLETNMSTHGPITQTQFNQAVKGIGTASLFDRQLAGNPYKDWNHFYIPYCTGDLHIGNADAVYTSGGVSVNFHHRGRANAEAFLARIAATVPEPEQVLVTGASAGGYGAVLNYALVRDTFPKARVVLVDDSGPMFKSGALRAELRAAWAQAWKYQPVFDAIDPAIKDDFSAIHPALARRYPRDRMALLSSTQDQVIRGYLLLTPAQFQTALLDLSSTVLEPLPNSRSFIISGQSHTMLGAPGSYRSQGVTLLEWLQQMQTADDATWKSLKP